MNLDVEYAIKKDIRNNPIVREVDLEHKRQLIRTVFVAAAVVAMLLFWVWQRFGMVETGYDNSVLRAQLALETALNRQLQLEVHMLLAPQLIENEATDQLHMVSPTSSSTLILDPPSGSHPQAVR